MGVELVKIQLVGALRYGYKGDKYEQNKHYLVKSDRAKMLLRLTTDYGLFVFKEVGKAHTPVAERPVTPRVRPIEVVDTTKTLEEQFDDKLSEADHDPTVEVVDLEDTEVAETEYEDPEATDKEDEGGTEV